ncbi:glycosyltransferase family 4 protein [Paenarthrobacter nicotinovorans]|uniref:glycosyltransferase family 4 protein n=1 Tax=Paenarthrobacter nicotinovorans TaxID=29320 RepID=UPI003814EF0D
MARFADTIICISSAARNSIPRRLHSRSVLLRNAHRGSNAPLVPFERLDGPLKFLIASRWNSWKGHASLLGAWDQDESPGQLLILGGPPSVGEGVDVEAIVQDLRHSGSISIVGQVEDISSYIDEVDFLVLPSDKPEPFGLVILEAFARGRPVIASRGGGVLDVVVEGSNGLLFDMGEPSQLHELIHNADRTLAASLGRQARRDFEENFSIESYESRLQNLWPELVRRG